MKSALSVPLMVCAAVVTGFFLGVAAHGGALSLIVGVAVAFGVGLFTSARVKSWMARPLRTASNVLDAIRNHDYGHRARINAETGPVAELLAETNALARHLAEERSRANEASVLLEAVVQRVDVALLAFDEPGELRWWNPAAERAFHGKLAPGTTARTLGVADWLEGAPERHVVLPGHPASATWDLRRGAFYRGGRRYQFVLLASLRRVRRAEERAAWQRLLRVVGHEVNNTLAPVTSMAATCKTMLRTEGTESVASVVRALEVIERRSESLGRFIGEYARLARLPEPTLVALEVGDVIRRVAAMDTRCTVNIIGSVETAVLADEPLLEQALVNLVRNAIDAAVTTGGDVTIDWGAEDGHALVSIADHGPGVENPENLFVPLFSTKPGGSGIGLVLARNIIEAHGGDVQLVNRSRGKGCIAHITLPLAERDLPSGERHRGR